MLSIHHSQSLQVISMYELSHGPRGGLLGGWKRSLFVSALRGWDLRDRSDLTAAMLLGRENYTGRAEVKPTFSSHRERPTLSFCPLSSKHFFILNSFGIKMTHIVDFSFKKHFFFSAQEIFLTLLDKFSLFSSPYSCSSFCTEFSFSGHFLLLSLTGFVLSSFQLVSLDGPPQILCSHSSGQVQSRRWVPKRCA